MKKARRVGSPIYSFFPEDIEGFDKLAELALDMRWSWNHSADEIWKKLDPANERHVLDRGWGNVRIGDVRVTEDGGRRVFEARVHCGSLDPEWLSVELYAEGAGEGGPLKVTMERGRPLEAENGFSYSARVAATRPAADLTVRVIPRLAGVKVPLEDGHILWQR